MLLDGFGRLFVVDFHNLATVLKTFITRHTVDQDKSEKSPLLKVVTAF